MRKRAFTLIELLVVISILVMLMGILLPAIIKAKQILTGLSSRNQIMTLVKACNAYSLAFDGQGFPAALNDPPSNPSGTPSMISGAQGLYLALMVGAPNAGKTFYTPKPGEVVPHSQITPLDTTQSGYDGTIPVFVDSMFSPAKPLLYYRERVRLVDGNGGDIAGYNRYDPRDNSVYVPTPTSYQLVDGSWSNSLAGYLTMTAVSDGFAIVGAGMDRAYFTSDDICSFSR